ncbi:MAG: trimeric intracellular cation channel family protein [Cyclobacteriaceae bacterium]|nr:trimeric intracellular cation channel family protein [Cyclobacteriaceae bacterium]
MQLGPFEILDQIGILTFAISGARLAFAKKLDVFGALFLAGVTAIGGGTLRDVLLNKGVFWLNDTYPLITIIIGVAITIIFRKIIVTLNRTLFVFDTIGLGVFVVVGLQKAMEAQLPPIQAILIGTVTAIFGGVIRDILSNEIPLIFRKEMYATACILGGVFYLLMGYLNAPLWVTSVSTMLVVIAFRIISIKFKLSYPMLSERD